MGWGGGGESPLGLVPHGTVASLSISVLSPSLLFV